MIGLKSMFKDKVVIVTGAASGIGLAQAEAFLAKGAIVYAIDLTFNQRLAKIKNCHFIQQDACLIDGIEELQNLDYVDILCNTCGILDDYLPLDQTSDILFEKIWQSNVLSFMKMSKFALKKMLPKKSGIIINMASIAGLIPGGGGLAYTTTKHAVVGMTKQLTYDYAHLGIRCNAIAPGAVKTKMTESDFLEDGAIAKEIANRIPVRRYATPQEVAELTLFLAGPNASYLQGDVIPIDGGWLQRN